MVIYYVQRRFSWIVLKFGEHIAADAERTTVVFSPHTPSPFESYGRCKLFASNILHLGQFVQQYVKMPCLMKDEELEREAIMVLILE